MEERSFIQMTSNVFDSVKRYFSISNKKKPKTNMDTIAILMLLVAFLTLGVLSLTLGVLSSQSKIMDKQTEILDRQVEILDRTSLSNRPEISIIAPKDKRAFQFDDFMERDQYLQIWLINEGKAEIPFFDINFEHQDWIGGGLQGQDRFWKLPSLGNNWTSVILSLNQINASSFERGVKNLTFKIDCPICIKTVSYPHLDICIYDSTPNDCGEGWE